MLANLVLLLHLTFLIFVVGGGLLLWRRPRLVWVHVPCVVWGLLLSAFGWTCPLTPLENTFRRMAQQQGYSGGFIEQYLVAIVYPDGLTPTLQWVLGAGLLLVNLVLYGLWLRRRVVAP